MEYCRKVKLNPITAVETENKVIKNDSSNENSNQCKSKLKSKIKHSLKKKYLKQKKIVKWEHVK